MLRKTRRFRAPLLTATLVAAVAVLLVTGGRPAWTDDRDLLKFDTSKPYLMILLDTSSSMALKMGPTDTWVPGGADSPDSRLYQAKQALWDVFKDAQDLHFGFAGYNQDQLRVVNKRWLYFVDEAGAPNPGTWPITFPLPDVGPCETGSLTHIGPQEDLNGNGCFDSGTEVPDAFGRQGDVGGDVMTFGPHFCSDPTAPMLVDCSTEFQPRGVAGTCPAPLDLDDPAGRDAAQSFSIAGNPDNTYLWIEEGGTVYRLTADLPGNKPDGTTPNSLGTDNLHVHFDLDRVETCTGDNSATFNDNSKYNAVLRLDAFLNDFLMVDDAPGAGVPGKPNREEAFAGLWPWTDIVSEADFGNTHPFTGDGFEGNYDSGPVSGDAPFDTLPNLDEFCAPGSCVQIKPARFTLPTFIGGVHAPALDMGDVIPFDWTNERRDVFLERLAPNVTVPADVPDFGGAGFFVDQPDNKGLLQLSNPGQRPLLAVDASPLSKAINDIRCWYLGKEGSGATGKCANSAFFDTGWETHACDLDSDFGCRRPFFILVTDGEDNSGGNDPTSNIAALNSHSGVKTWAINLGDADNCTSGGGLKPIVTAGKGECVTAATREDLKTALRDILGQIREAARAFASAAVPTVQANVEKKIFLTNFTPLANEAVWDGHVNAFIKPVPTVDGRPDTSPTARCSPPPPDGSDSSCFLWDAGEVILSTPTNATDQASSGDMGDLAKRRVFYAQLNSSGGPPAQRELFSPPDASTPAATRYDLWEALGIPYVPDAPGPVPDQAALDRSIAVINETLAVKTSTIDVIDPNTGNTTSTPVTYLLGDVFHSTPLVLGSPPSTQNFAADLFTAEGDPTADCDVEDAANERPANTGYRCFFRRHLSRRRMLMVGSNDGQLHVFDAGRFHESYTEPIIGAALVNEFDEGTGKEIFAFMPREVMPTVTVLAEGDLHDWTMDGSVAAFDAFIDPKFGAAGPDPDHRQWRTVAVSGLRRGGSAYFALDVTQPDRLSLNTDGLFVPDDVDDYDVPTCVLSPVPADCGPLPFPSLLWEFTDSVFDPALGVSGEWVRLDEDFDGGGGNPGSGIADLGESWSTPNLGRIQVCAVGGTACTADDPDPLNRADVLELFVAVFGGGMDIDGKATPDAAATGDWLYMVNVETGEVIYKRQLDGAVPSEVAAVDTDQDGILDRLYAGTLAGLMYRVDLVADASGDVPALADPGAKPGVDGLMHDVPPRVPDTEWVPRVLFDTEAPQSATDGTLVRRPIYQRPSIFFIAKLGLYGVGFGTGDREDLWSIAQREERFYVFVDDTSDLSPPLIEDNFQRVDLGDVFTNADYLLDPAAVPGTRGWFLVLNEEERVITDAFNLSGVTVFSSFRPRVDVTDPNGNPVDPGCEQQGGGGPAQGEGRCARVGNSNIFAVNTTNANGLLVDAAGTDVRAIEVSTFVSNPFTEPSGTDNPVDGGGTTADDLDARLTDIMESLKALFPKNCKFANYRIDVKTIAADTTMQFIAPIPVCIVDKNWKEY